MTVPLPILNHGSCEPFKAGVHGIALGLAALMGLYNAAAWINRRDPHLAVNAVLYGLAIAWERRLVAQHIRECRALAARRAMSAVTRGETDESCDLLEVA
jgi:hypothetical protein